MPEVNNEAMTKEVVERITPMITEKVFADIMEKMPDRGKVLTAEEKAVEEKQAIAGKLRDLEAGRVKALNTATATDGAEFVPTYVSTQVQRVASAAGLVDKYAFRYPMQGSKESVPTADSVSAYRVAEGVKISSSQPTTGNIALTSKTVGVIVPFSRKLLRNANPAMVDLILQLAGEAMAKLKDQWAFLGLGAGEGVFQDTDVTGVTLASGKTDYADVTAEDMLDMIDIIDENVSSDRLRWVFSRSYLNILRRLRAAVGTDQQGFLFAGFGAGTPATVWDIPYSLSPIMPKKADSSQAGKKFAALVDFGRIIHGVDEGVKIEMSEQATITDTNGSTLINLFEQEMVAIKVTQEVDIQLSTPDKSFSWIKTAAT